MSTTRTFSVALVTALTIGAAQPQAQSLPEGDLLRTWLSAVVQHRPGHADAAASLVAHWSAADVERLLPGLFFYLELVRRTELENRDVPKCSTCAVSRDERERLLRVTRSRVPRAQQVLISSFPHPDRLDDLLLQAVSLHSDAVMLFPSNSGQQVSGVPPPSTNVLGAPREHIQTADGQFSGTAPAVPHWYLARALLHFSVTEPPLDAHARRWYLATSTYLAAASDLAQAATHIAIMRSLFPNDATVMFDAGWLAETHSTPRVQTHLRALLDTASRQSGGRRRPPCERLLCDANGNPNGIKPERESLLDAERSFARAVALDPSLTEAFVRLAHVQTRLGRHTDAEATLRTMPQSTDPVVNFYAALVRGMTLEALDKLDDAGAAYQKALDLFPTAQSANLSLSALHQKRGDTPMATTYAQRGIDTPAEQVAEFDPIVPYRLGRGRHVQEAWAAYNASREQAR
jgi:tetratricopeptide (TPR) repeat protein